MHERNALVRKWDGSVMSRRGLGRAVLRAVADVFSRANNPAALDRRALKLYRAGKTAEAFTLAERSLALREKLLPAGHPEIAASLNIVAFLYQALGRLAKAEPLFARALDMLEKALPADHLDIAAGLERWRCSIRLRGVLRKPSRS
jgi:tetratricopeptide (TPR) repeat protein